MGRAIGIDLGTTYSVGDRGRSADHTQVAEELLSISEMRGSFRAHDNDLLSRSNVL